MKNTVFVIPLLIFFLQMPLFGQTDFSASKTVGCDSLTVKFTYTTTASVTSVLWRFGDNTSSTETSPQHTYSTSGLFLVSVIINSTDSVGKTGYIKIGKTPKADFGYHDTLGFGSNTIVFDAKDPGASLFPFDFHWSTSDGASADTRAFFHEFDTTGNYLAKLIVNDQYGCADTLEQTIVVRDKLNVPNVFTPNEDNFNDLFVVKGDDKTTYSFKVFTPAGVKVFESKSKIIVWDGRMFSGDTVREGVYYYIIQSLDGTSAIKQTGFFYLYR